MISTIDILSALPDDKALNLFNTIAVGKCYDSKLIKNMKFEPQLISEDELQNRLKNPNTEGIFVPECLNFRYGNLGFISNI